MKEITTYLNFDGNARQAMEFYQKCLGGELEVLPLSATPCNVAEKDKDGLAHARLSKGSATLLMASDATCEMAYSKGNNFSVSLNCESLPEIQQTFAALGENGKVILPLQDMFWGGHFGVLTDQFGVNWLFNYEYPK